MLIAWDEGKHRFRANAKVNTQSNQANGGNEQILITLCDIDDLCLDSK